MARARATRLYLVTCKASRRRVGGAVYRRGDSFTVPVTADVRRFRDSPAWDVTTISGIDGKRRAPEPTPGTPGGAAVSPRANATFTGLVNRLKAAGQAAERLEPVHLSGYQAMISGRSRFELGSWLAKALGGDPAAWAALLEDTERLAPALEALDAAEAEPFPELPAEGLAAKPGDRGVDADAEDPDAEAEADTTTTPQGEAPSSTEPEASPAERAARLAEGVTVPSPSEVQDAAKAMARGQALEAFQAALVDFAEDGNATTMDQLRGLASDAGLELPAEVHRVRRRDELAQVLTELLANHLAGSATTDATPSPTELEG